MDNIGKLLKKLDEYFKKTPPEKIRKELEEIMNDFVPCDPKTCDGQCQGMGGCDVAIGFRKDYNIVLPTICKGEVRRDKKRKKSKN